MQGTILAQGTADARITFTASDPYLFTYDEDLAGCWNGFKFINTSDTNSPSLFSYTILEYAKSLADGALFHVENFDKLKVENSICRYNYASYGAIFSVNKDSNITFINNQVTDNMVALGGSLGLISYSNPRIANNTIVNNEVLNQDDFHSTGVIESFISKPIIYNNIIFANSDYFFEDNQLFSAKAYHTCFNGLDFTFGNNNILLSDMNFEIDENGIYIATYSEEIVDSASLELPFDIQLPQTDILGNPRLNNALLDLGAVELQPVNNHDIIKPVVNQISLYPNPFNPEITIEFPTSIDLNSNLTIYNIKGQVVRKFTLDDISDNKVVWNSNNNQGKQVSSGIYLFKYTSKNHTQTKKALLLK